MTKSIKVGLVGVGSMGRNHFRVLNLLETFELIGIHDIGISSPEYNGVRVFSQFDELAKICDALVIASPTTTHFEYIVKASQFVKNIFVEKPLTATLADSKAIRQLGMDKNINLQVGFIERFNPAVTELKKLLNLSKSVVSIDFTRTNKLSSRITDVDVITDLMIHDIDLALYLNGPVRSVAAQGVRDGEMIGYASALLVHENGKFSRIQSSRITDKKIRSIQATCRDCFIDCELLRKEIKLYKETQTVEPVQGAPYKIVSIEESIEVLPREALQLELIAFGQLCVGSIKQGDIPNVEDGCAAIDICHQISSRI